MEEKTYIEVIECPTCQHVQEAEVRESWPNTIYQHECENCQYIITAEEWQEVEQDQL